MANWYATARSNYVRVKDRETFLHWADSVPDVKAVEKEGRFALLVTGDAGWPSHRGVNCDQEFNLAAEISDHIAEDEVFVMMEVGAEKLRYVTGWARAVNSAGEMLAVSIHDIYALALEYWQITPTKAQY